jgi:hypothetical protein
MERAEGMSGLVLSLFPGIGLLDMAFEEEGFCVVRGPDLLWGGDIKNFHPPRGKFNGVKYGKTHIRGAMEVARAAITTVLEAQLEWADTDPDAHLDDEEVFRHFARVHNIILSKED